MKIGERLIGKNQPCFIIAEVGINHNGDLETAKKMIEAAKGCEVDAIKFQTFKAEEFVSEKGQEYEYTSQGKKVKESMLEMFKRHEFTKEEWREIAYYCKEKEILFFSTPQNPSDLEILMEIGVPVIKIGSDDLTNLPLLEEYAKKGLPLIISTGMAEMPEVDDAVDTIKKHNDELAILHCISSYPADFEELNMNVITILKQRFPDCVIGFSDHSEGSMASVVSTALNSKIFEKHFTLDKSMKGPDHHFSADPGELRKIVESIRLTEKMLGGYEKKPTKKEESMKEVARRSIVAINDIKRGDVFTPENIGLKRPGTGISPKRYAKIIGKKATQDVSKGNLLKEEDFEND